MEIGDNGLPTMNGTPDPMLPAVSTKKTVNRQAAADSALAHYKDKPKFGNDCANSSPGRCTTEAG